MFTSGWSFSRCGLLTHQSIKECLPFQQWRKSSGKALKRCPFTSHCQRHLLQLSYMYLLMMGWTPVAQDLIAHKHSQGMGEERPGCGAGVQRWQHLLYSGIESHRSTLMRPPRPLKCILFPFPLLSSSCSFPHPGFFIPRIYSLSKIFLLFLYHLLSPAIKWAPVE